MSCLKVSRPYFIMQRVKVINKLVERGCDGVIVENAGDVTEQQSSIEVISDVSTIVHSSNQILQSLPWCVIVLIQVDGEQVFRHLQV